MLPHSVFRCREARIFACAYTPVGIRPTAAVHGLPRDVSGRDRAPASQRSWHGREETVLFSAGRSVFLGLFPSCLPRQTSMGKQSRPRHLDTEPALLVTPVWPAAGLGGTGPQARGVWAGQFRDNWLLRGYPVPPVASPPSVYETRRNGFCL